MNKITCLFCFLLLQQHLFADVELGGTPSLTNKTGFILSCAAGLVLLFITILSKKKKK